jgi:hypothetical protein
LVTPSPITGTTSPVDQLPDWRVVYTYQVQAYQANGSVGTATVDYTPHRPTDPLQLNANLTSSGDLQLSWAPAPDVTQYLLTGAGVAPNSIIIGTSYTISSPPTGTNVYQVASVFQPGGVLTPQSDWPKAVVAVGAVPGTPPPTLPCACTDKGAFVGPTQSPLGAGGKTISFGTPTAGTFTVNAVRTGTGFALEVLNGNFPVFTEPDATGWRFSPGESFLGVESKPASAGGKWVVRVYRVGRGPWAPILEQTVTAGAFWGFSNRSSIFVVTQPAVPAWFRFWAYDLRAASPATAMLDFKDDKVLDAMITISPCEDQLLYARFLDIPTKYTRIQGRGDFYRRTRLGAQVPPVATFWNNINQLLPLVDVIQGPNNTFLVLLDNLTTATGQQTIPSPQCAP